MANRPTVFVSSTCYDLSQIRLNIKEFIESLGFEALLSEFANFPIDPNNTIIENCLRAVENSADIFVLIVGGRYGTRADQGKSITNLEYSVAKRLNIPLYVFVQKSVLNSIRIWEKNPSCNFDAVVDSNDVFTFVKNLQSTKHWTHAFESADGIVKPLREQLAYLFSETLQFRKKVIASQLPKGAHDLSPRALKTLLEQEPGWEFLLFSHVLEDVIDSVMYDKYDMENQVVLNDIKFLSDPLELSSFMRTKTAKAMSTVEWVANLINNNLANAFGEPGQPGNAEQIIYIGRRIGNAYKQFIEWSLSFYSLDVPDEFKQILIAGSQLCHAIITEIEGFPQRLKDGMQVALQSPGERVCIDLTFTVPNVNDVINAMQALTEEYLREAE